jgi:hypothetical protein
VVAELELQYRRDEKVIRYLTVTLDKDAIAYAEKRRTHKFGQKKETKPEVGFEIKPEPKYEARIEPKYEVTEEPVVEINEPAVDQINEQIQENKEE